MKLEKTKIAILATDGFQSKELFEPLEMLKKEGAQVDIISPKKGEIKGMIDGEWGRAIAVDRQASEANAADYDGLMIPGGVINPDTLRADESSINFIDGFFKENAQKPVAAICHGPQVLIDANVVKGRKMTSFKSIRKDLENAGAHWVDEEVVVDKGLVTSRSPKDLTAFNRKMVEEFREGVHRK